MIGHYDLAEVRCWTRHSKWEWSEDKCERQMRNGWGYNWPGGSATWTELHCCMCKLRWSCLLIGYGHRSCFTEFNDSRSNWHSWERGTPSRYTIVDGGLCHFGTTPFNANVSIIVRHVAFVRHHVKSSTVFGGCDLREANGMKRMILNGFILPSGRKVNTFVLRP